MRSIIAVALHRRAPVPQGAPYLPVQAGAALHPPLGCARDDGPGSISTRNPLYCELTVHHHLWQQLDADVYGLCHYRRYFTLRPFGRRLAHALTQAQLDRLMQRADVLVPRPRLYLIETNASHYAHAHRGSDLALVRQVISDARPDFLPAFDRVMKRRWGRRFNIFIMRREPFCAYSAWLFGILGEVETRLGGDLPPRTLGYLGERLMDVWLEKERPRLRQLRVLNTEGEDWPRKITAFLRRKFAAGHVKQTGK